jgi:DNA repair protein radC
MSDNIMMRHLADDEKPREKAMSRGIGALTDAELLAILLRVGVAGRNVIDVSRDILSHYGQDLGRLAKASPRELSQLVPGIGPAKAITVIAALELGQRCRSALARVKPQMTSSRVIHEYMLDKFESKDHEEFWAIMLNKRLGVESTELISAGGLDTTVVDVRVLVKRALDARATHLALVHNHPSGALTPSMQDDSLTRRIKQACELLDIRVVDHVIITPTGYYSYADQGRL